MEMIEIQGYDDFQGHLSKHGQLYLLFYKSGSEKSDCAYENIKTVTSKIKESGAVLTADVNRVRDIHSNYGIQTAPALLEFEKGALKQTVKGCQSIDYLTSFFQHSVYSGEKREKSRQKRVIVYSTPTCPHCNTLKDYLKRNQIPFRDIDVSKDQKMAQELVKKSGQQGVPQTEINGKIVVGFNRSKINEMLGIQA
ncbi:MAG: glutaredoxin domain-containing protein [Bacteroidota bacterium]